ncbi:hypothetical protein GLYMA_02G140700v4 [Glycine max]|uniref:Uncharacterized protein n=1 Tax=Glycine max TaxID=3847 RepID=A0A0R0KWW5_SOYBN|nr:hypothetical protein GLYMA_02G140700v4 [Glycine max]
MVAGCVGWGAMANSKSFLLGLTTEPDGDKVVKTLSGRSLTAGSTSREHPTGKGDDRASRQSAVVSPADIPASLGGNVPDGHEMTESMSSSATSEGTSSDELHRFLPWRVSPNSPPPFSSTISMRCLTPSMRTCATCWMSGGRGVLTRILARSRRCMCSTSSSTSTKSPTAATILRMKSVFHARRGIPQTRSQTSLVSALS